jgi:2'-5' RNA ligase
MEHLKVGFALVPCVRDIELLIELQQQITSQYDLRPILSDSVNLPHLTIFQGTFESSLPYKDLLLRLREQAIGLRVSWQLSCGQVVHQPVGWYFLLVQAACELLALHAQLLDWCKPYIVLGDPKDPGYLSAMSAGEQKSFLTYGYRYAAECYMPHVTLGRLQSSSVDKVLNVANGYRNSLSNLTAINFDRLTVYTMGENGSHSETLASVVI